MQKSSYQTLFLIVIVFLSSCAGIDELNKVASSAIQTIALLEVENPPAYHLVRPSESSEGAWGLFLGVLQMKREQQESKPLEQIMGEYDFNFGRQMTKELEQKLQNAGYQVVVVPRENKNSVSAQAYLDVQPMSIGYISLTKGEYIPWLETTVTFAATQNGSTLYHAEINYGPEGSAVSADSRYVLKGDDLLSLFESNKELVIEAMQAGTMAIAEQIGINIAK